MKKFLSTLFLLLALLSNNVCFAETVVFNVKTHKYHSIYCEWALKCTKNCIKIDKKEAIKRGGVPCKICGGHR